jgi:hypothetical protein
MVDRTTPKLTLVAGATLAAALLLPLASQASLSADVSMEILVDGVPLREYPARGTTYVEARANAEYSIRLYNRSNRRVAVALAVDGLNSIDARTTTAARAAKWVIDPRSSITIDGWQTSTEEARRFFFTTEESSYGAWLGKTTNLGVIEAVVFRERLMPNELADSMARREKARGDAEAAPSPAPADAAREGAAKRLPDPLAATGIGRSIDNPVRRVHLDLEPRPIADLVIRYEYRPQLLALGVLPPPALPYDLGRREQARGFTDSGFCPVPPFVK